MNAIAWDDVAASKPAYRVLTPASVVYWFSLALVAERNGRDDLRERCLARAADVTEERGTRPSGPSTNAAHTNARMAEDEDAITAADAESYDEFHMQWERDEWRDRANRYEAALSKIPALEGADPDGTVWTWKTLFCKAEAIAKQALEAEK